MMNEHKSGDPAELVKVTIRLNCLINVNTRSQWAQRFKYVRALCSIYSTCALIERAMYSFAQQHG